MSALTTAKRLSIASRLYRPARWLARRIRPQKIHAFREEVKFYRSLIAPGALCFDVGANVGEKSEALLKAGGRVVAFEPHPAVLPELRARCAHDKNWTVVQAALGRTAAVATLYAREIHGQSSLKKEWEGTIIGSHHVPVVTLDSAIQHFGRPHYCKIDVEGFELEVLNGLTQAIPLISFEFHLNEPDIRKTKECLERIATFGAACANITAAEACAFQLEDWVPLTRFVEWFPRDLRLPGYQYGDIFVRNEDA